MAIPKIVKMEEKMDGTHILLEDGSETIIEGYPNCKDTRYTYLVEFIGGDSSIKCFTDEEAKEYCKNNILKSCTKMEPETQKTWVEREF